MATEQGTCGSLEKLWICKEDLIMKIIDGGVTAAKGFQAAAAAAEITANMPSTGIKMAIAVVGVLPVLIVYPFFQKYFVKGITIGAVKG